MKILIDIGHPAHVHYFRNLIKLMQQNDHTFLISARDKEVSHILLEKYDIPYFNRGKGCKHLMGKLFYLIKADFVLLLKSLKFNPDVLLSFASPYAAHVAKIIGKPHISLTDTDKARLAILSFAPFTKTILTPMSFKKDFREKHIRFKGFMELCYLHPDYYRPDERIPKELGIGSNEKYILFRFVSFNANHDIGQSGFDTESKIKIIQQFSRQYKIFISSESSLPESLKPYQLTISPEKIHDIMAFATLYIGEGATMASECAMLGTPAIYVNSLTAGTIEEQERYGLVYSFRNSSGVMEKALELLKNPNLHDEFLVKRNKMMNDQINVTKFLVWFLENFPLSKKVMKENPDFQLKFK
jgi:predicted glycosyltransferase